MYNTRKLIYAGCLLFMFYSQVLTEAFAEPLKSDRVDVFQLKSITKKRRHEFMPLFSLTLNDPFIQTMTAGLSYTYHLTEGIAFELMGAIAFTANSPLIEQLKVQDEKAVLRPSDGSQPNTKFSPVVSRAQVYATGSLVWTPFVGKFMIGGLIFDNNIYLVVGGGYVMANSANVLIHLPSFHAGFGYRIMLTRWLSLRLDVRDQIFSQTLNNVTILNHNLFFTLGLGFFLPVAPIYG